MLWKGPDSPDNPLSDSVIGEQEQNDMKRHTLTVLGLLLVAGYHAQAMSSEPTPLSINVDLLPYNEQLESRHRASIRRVVVHCTELPDLASARAYGERVHYPESGTGNSGHFYIDRDGGVYQWVELDRVAHHVAGENADSIGIELVNLGRYPNWHHSEQQSMTQPYTKEQIKALLKLLIELKTEIPGLDRINGHQDLDQRLIRSEDNPSRQISRKLDPGPLFPWDEVLATTGLQRSVN
jgi:N-acetylmuramoyl-L-alanine amidase